MRPDLTSSTRAPTSVRALPAQTAAARTMTAATERPRGPHAIRATTGIETERELPRAAQLAAASRARASQFGGLP